MVRLYPTPADKLVDAQGRPYFLWDVDMTLDAFTTKLREETPAAKAYLIGKLMRQAKPDDVLTFVTVDEIVAAWKDIDRYLGKKREFWRWLVEYWACDLG